MLLGAFGCLCSGAVAGYVDGGGHGAVAGKEQGECAEGEEKVQSERNLSTKRERTAGRRRVKKTVVAVNRVCCLRTLLEAPTLPVPTPAVASIPVCACNWGASLADPVIFPVYRRKFQSASHPKVQA
jgi:hypothetical protein